MRFPATARSPAVPEGATTPESFASVMDDRDSRMFWLPDDTRMYTGHGDDPRSAGSGRAWRNGAPEAGRSEQQIGLRPRANTPLRRSASRQAVSGDVAAEKQPQAAPRTTPRGLSS